MIVPFEFYASHSLSVREKPHNHFWALKLYVRGVPKDGMVVDILKLRQITDPYVEKLADTYLNENSCFDRRASRMSHMRDAGGLLLRARLQGIGCV